MLHLSLDRKSFFLWPFIFSSFKTDWTLKKMVGKQRICGRISCPASNGFVPQTPKLRFALPAWKEVFLRPFLSLRSIFIRFHLFKRKKATIDYCCFSIIWFNFSKRFWNFSNLGFLSALFFGTCSSKTLIAFLRTLFSSSYNFFLR